MDNEIILKDGSVTKDRRLDRILQCDSRNKGFGIARRLSLMAPRTALWECKTQLDQGYDGACVGFAFGHDLAAEPVPIQGINDKIAKESIYWPAQQIDEWDGGSYPNATPFYEGTSVLAGAKVIRKMGYISEYRWAFDIEELWMTVAQFGPVIIGVNWYSGMMNPDANGLVHVKGYVVGGHCVLVRGVNNTTSQLQIRNSWGAGWGKNGDCFIGYDDMDRLLQEDGEACIPMGRTFLPVEPSNPQPEPKPEPQPEPAPSSDVKITKEMLLQVLQVIKSLQEVDVKDDASIADLKAQVQQYKESYELVHDVQLANAIDSVVKNAASVTPK